MKINRQLSREEWLRHVESARASDLSLSAYCRKHGLNRSSMDNWHRRYHLKALSQSVSPFVRAEVMASPPTVPDAKWVAEFLSHFLEVRT